jgi:integrase
MCHTFIPFLKANSIKNFSEITPPVIANFQNHLLSGGLKPQSINRYMGSVKAVFDQLLMTGVIQESAFDRVRMLKTGTKAAEARGCYDIDSMPGVFREPWGDVLSYLLCLMIYSTGMRNSEIEKTRVNDLIELDGIHFVNIRESKTKSGLRLVPVHEFVYGKIQHYIRETGKVEEDYIFSARGGPNQSTLYNKANALLGEKLGLSEKDLDEQKITFYSGRHFWKTVMNSEGLGEDVEEYFMGHKVSGDVAKNYNHKEKQGKRKLIEKVKEIFAVLDKKLFTSAPFPA